MSRRVVVTGLSVYAGSGCGKEAFFKALYDKEQQARLLPENYCLYGTPSTKWYVPFPQMEQVMQGEAAKKIGHKGSDGAILAAVSAMEALKDAGIREPERNTAVYVGVGVTNIREVQEGYISMRENKRYPRLSVPQGMVNSIAAWISITLGLHGESLVCSAACASGTMSIGMGYRHILHGEADMALCGGEECLAGDHGNTLMGFSSLNALTHSENGNCAAFSEEHSGFLYSEGGAAMLVLEEYQHAVSRGARIYAEITDYRANADAYHVVAIAPSAEDITELLSGISADRQIDYYNAHGTATTMNDNAERDVIHRIWGDKQPLINSTKSVFGHSLGASGAIEAAVCCDSIYSGRVHGTMTSTRLPDLNVVTEAQKADIRCALSASFGFGGHNCALRFETIGR